MMKLGMSKTENNVMYCSDIGAQTVTKSVLDFSQMFGHAQDAEVAKPS